MFHCYTSATLWPAAFNRRFIPDAPHLQTIAGFLRLAGDIPALYGEPLTEYGKCYEALEFLIEGVLARLKEEEEQ